MPAEREDLLAEAPAALAAGSRQQTADSSERMGRRRYPLPLTRDSQGHWVAEHRFEQLGELEIVKVMFTGSEEAFVVSAFIIDGSRPGSACRSPFGPGERVAGLRLPLWLFGTSARRADLLPPFAEWGPGDIVKFAAEGAVEAGALLCRKKGCP